METREALEKRVAELERQISALRGGAFPLRGLRRRASCCGGLSVGVLGAIGGPAIGGLALGGAAIGGVALGGGAVGYYACGGGAAGLHVVAAGRRDEQAEEFFREYGLAPFCGSR